MSPKGIFILLLLFCSKAVSGQYHVLQVSGRISAERQGYLRPGMVIDSDAALAFSGSDPFLRVIGPDGKTLIIPKPPPGPHIGLSVEITTIANSSRYNIDFSNSFQNLQVYKLTDSLKDFPRLVIESRNNFVLDTDRNSPANGRFFLRIRLQTGEAISKPLTLHKDTAIITYNDFLVGDADPRQSKYGIQYYNNKNGTTVNVRAIYPYFDISNNLETMVSAAVDFYKTKYKNKDSVYRKTLAQVHDAFGTPSIADFRRIFERYYQGLDKKQGPILLGHGNRIEPHKSGAPKGAPIRPSGPAIINAIDRGTKSIRGFAPQTPGYQGQTGTCTAWASAYGACSLTYNKQHPPNRIAFSPEFVYEQTDPGVVKGDNCDSGIAITSAIAFMASTGNLVKQDLNYTCHLQFTPQQISAAAGFKVIAHHTLFDYRSAPFGINEVVAIQQSISRDGKPVIFSMLLPLRPVVNGSETMNSFDSLSVTHNGDWTPRPWDYDNLKDRSFTQHDSHSMCIVGYSAENGGSFEVLNSWGTDFGAGGYFFLNYEDFEKFVLNAYVIDAIGTGNVNATLLKTKTTGKVKIVPASGAPKH